MKTFNQTTRHLVKTIAATLTLSSIGLFAGPAFADMDTVTGADTNAVVVYAVSPNPSVTGDFVAADADTDPITQDGVADASAAAYNFALLAAQGFDPAYVANIQWQTAGFYDMTQSASATESNPTIGADGTIYAYPLDDYGNPVKTVVGHT